MTMKNPPPPPTSFSLSTNTTTLLTMIVSSVQKLKMMWHPPFSASSFACSPILIYTVPAYSAFSLHPHSYSTCLWCFYYFHCLHFSPHPHLHSAYLWCFYYFHCLHFFLHPYLYSACLWCFFISAK